MDLNAAMHPVRSAANFACRRPVILSQALVIPSHPPVFLSAAKDLGGGSRREIAPATCRPTPRSFALAQDDRVDVSRTSACPAVVVLGHSLFAQVDGVRASHPFAAVAGENP